MCHQALQYPQDSLTNFSLQTTTYTVNTLYRHHYSNIQTCIYSHCLAYKRIFPGMSLCTDWGWPSLQFPLSQTSIVLTVPACSQSINTAQQYHSRNLEDHGICKSCINYSIDYPKPRNKRYCSQYMIAIVVLKIRRTSITEISMSIVHISHTKTIN